MCSPTLSPSPLDLTIGMQSSGAQQLGFPSRRAPRPTPRDFASFQFFCPKFVLQPSQVDNYPTCDAIVATLPLKYGVCAAVASRIFEKEKRKWNRNHATTAWIKKDQTQLHCRLQERAKTRTLQPRSRADERKSKSSRFKVHFSFQISRSKRDLWLSSRILVCIPMTISSLIFSGTGCHKMIRIAKRIILTKYYRVWIFWPALAATRLEWKK